MNIITKQKVYTTDVPYNPESADNDAFYDNIERYSGADAVQTLPTKNIKDIIQPTPAPPVGATAAELKKKGWDWDKIKGWVQKGAAIGQSTGVFDWAKNKVGINSPNDPNARPPVSTNDAPPAPEESGMSTQTKVIIGVGAAVAIAAIVFVIVKKK